MRSYEAINKYRIKLIQHVNIDNPMTDKQSFESHTPMMHGRVSIEI